MSPAPSTLDLSPAPSTSAANLKPRQGGESSRAPPALVCPVAKLGTKKETLTLYFFFLRKLFLFFSFTVSLLEFLLVPSIFISYLNSRQFCRFGRFGFGQFFRFKLNFHVLFQILKLQQHLYFYLLRFFSSRSFFFLSFRSSFISSPEASSSSCAFPSSADFSAASSLLAEFSTAVLSGALSGTSTAGGRPTAAAGHPAGSELKRSIVFYHLSSFNYTELPTFFITHLPLLIYKAPHFFNQLSSINYKVPQFFVTCLLFTKSSSVYITFLPLINHKGPSFFITCLLKH